jgi:hypothetical protein
MTGSSLTTTPNRDRLEALAKEKGWRLEWTREPWFGALGWTQVDIYRGQRFIGCHWSAHTSCINATDAGERVAEMILKALPGRGARLAA